MTWLTRGVLAIGLASLLSDVSHEMATAILPIFLLGVGGSPALLGLIEGLADLGATAAKLGAGLIGDRIRHKRVAAAGGYLVTALSKGSLALAFTWPAVLAARVVGWLGRGFRSPLRDALLAEQTEPEYFGRAFGLERAMDSLGAVAGPACVLGLIAAGLPMRHIFWWTLVPGVGAALVVLLGVREAPPPVEEKHLERAPLPGPYLRLLMAIGLFGLGDFSRTLLILWATGGKLTLARTPIALYVLYNIVGALASFLAGRRSDAVGRKPLLVLAYTIALGTSCALVFARPQLGWAIPVFVASGMYTGILEAVEKAAAADFLPRTGRSWGFAVLATVTGVGDFVSSLIVGLLWQKVGPAAAFGYSAGAMGLGLVLLLGWTSARRAP